MSSTADNPYAAPNEIDSLREGIDVDGHLLIVLGRRGKLPDRCVFTNRSTKWYQRITQYLSWSGQRGQFMVRGRSCRVTHAVCASIRLRMLMTTISGALIIGSTLVGIVTFGVSNYFGLIISAMVLIAGLAMGWKADAPTLRVEHWNDGRFAISGCCQEFLDQLAVELRTVSGE